MFERHLTGLFSPLLKRALEGLLGVQRAIVGNFDSHRHKIMSGGRLCKPAYVTGEHTENG
jgi:hypothetical protein